MLNSYAKTEAIPNDHKVNYSDTATIVSGYAKSGLVVKYADTAAMLNSYAKTEAIPNVSGKVNYSDTASIVSGYAKSGSGSKIC
jgi:ABC-type tungstate transport system permease subunit